MKRFIIPLLASLLIAAPAPAQITGDRTLERERPALSVAEAEAQERCITAISAVPDAGAMERYQFFRLIEAVGADATPEFRTVLDVYGDGEVMADTPIPELIEGIANPVLRQAAPSISVSQSAHLIEFAKTCQPFVSGQITSLAAYDPALTEADFNMIILEDALFLRQVLADALYRLEADRNPEHAATVISYARSLVGARNDLEFQGFASEVDELEALFMDDLDGRLARSNDIINGEMSTEALESAVSLSRDLNDSARKQHEEQRRLSLLRMLRIFQ